MIGPVSITALVVAAFASLLYLCAGAALLLYMDSKGRFRAVMKRWSTPKEHLALYFWPLAVLYVIRRARRRVRPF